MPAEITLEGVGSGIQPELAAAPARPARPYDRRRDGLTARRRRGDAHRIVACALAVLALVGCVTAILLLAVAPTAARLDGEIGSLSTRLASTQSKLAALHAAATRAASEGSRVTRTVRLLSRRFRGLTRTVHGLQSSSTLTRAQTAGLGVCFSQLRRELSGLTLKTRSAHGRVSSVSLSDLAGPSPACGVVFAGG